MNPTRPHLKRKRRPPPAHRWQHDCHLLLERLEDRTLLSAGDSIANAIGLSFPTGSASIQTTEYLASPGSVEINRLSLNAGDIVTAAVNTAPYGGGLDSDLRIFQDLGSGDVRQIAAAVNSQGRDPVVTFQAQSAGDYYIGVSSFDDTAYNPAVPGSGVGTSTGLFDLDLTQDAAPPIALNAGNGPVALPVGASQFFQIVLTQPGNLAIQADASGGRVTLALCDADGVPIVQSDGQSLSNPIPSITQGLTGAGSGTVYFLKVSNRGDAATSVTLTNQFTSSVSALQTVPLDAPGIALVEGDFNGDGIPDLATATADSEMVTVLLGNGDGTFQNAGSFDAGINVQTLAVGDLTDDGRLDLIAANPGNDGVAALLGDGAGNFTALPALNVTGGNSLALGEFTGDGHLDLAIANSSAHSVTVLLGDGQGGFTMAPQSPILVSGSPGALVAGAFNEGGPVDLAYADGPDNEVSILKGNGDGTFQSAGTFGVGRDPNALAIGDFNGDGHLDLATANYLGNSVTILLGNGRGSFQNVGDTPVGNRPLALITGDFNGDGRTDLATANAGSNDVTTLLNQGDGAFRSGGSFACGSDPQALVAGDFDADGKLDLAVVNYRSDDIKIQLCSGDGTFPPIQGPTATGQAPDAIVTGDFNGDGRLDLATANFNSGNVSILLGQGNGTFVSAGTFAVGDGPDALAVGDFNGDGLLDLAVANQRSDDVTVLLGDGAGGFHLAGTYPLPGQPSALVAGDFDGDGFLDLAVAIEFNADKSFGNSVVILQGDGHGNFTSGGAFATGTEPDALVAGDFTGDGHLDLATANQGSNDVTILLGDGSGDFQGPISIPIAADAQDQAAGFTAAPMALVAGDFGSNGHVDLAVASSSYYCDNVTVLLGDGLGDFQATAPVSVNTAITSLAAGDFNGDGILDLAIAGPDDVATGADINTVTVLLGTGDGGFQPPTTFPVGNQPTAVAVGDFNGDGRLDLAVADGGSSDVTVLLGDGAGAFTAPLLTPNPVLSTPLIANLTGGPTPDAVVLSQSGQILFRQGLTDAPGDFAPPVVLNPDPSQAARDIALVQTISANPPQASEASGDDFLAALDAFATAVPGDPSTAPVTQVQLYVPHADGTFTALPALRLPAGVLPASIASADLTGNGLGDLVISADNPGQVFVILQISPGVFGPIEAYSVGPSPSAIDLTDITGSGLPDIVVADRFSGQVPVLANQGNGVFNPAVPFSAGAALHTLTTIPGGQAVQSLLGTSGIAAGAFTAGAGPDLVAINSGSQTLTLLPGDGLGGVLNPQAADTVFLGTTPTAIVTGHFISGDPNLDVAVLSADAGTISIYRSDGDGGFTLLNTVSAGNDPTGLAVADVSRPDGGGPDGIPDLLVGNIYGDLLILPGNGDGTFAPYRRADQNVALAVAPSSASGLNTFYFSQQANDLLSYKSAAPNAATVADPAVFQDRNDAIQAPGPETVVTVAGTSYLVVLNSGSNELLIYALDADGRPDFEAKQTYFTGTDPVALAVTGADNDLNGDGLPDVAVANQGSNDASIFTGRMVGNTWMLEYRPRISSDGIGPSSIAVADIAGTPSLVIGNALSNNIAVIPGRGDGYFAGQDAIVLGTGAGPEQLFVGAFNHDDVPDLIAVNAGSRDVTLTTNFTTNPVTTTLAADGAFRAGVLTDQNGVADLLIANLDTHRLELLQDQPAGFEVAKTWTETSVPNISDLTLVLAGNQVDVYGTDTEADGAALMAVFNPPAPSTNFFPPTPGFGEGFTVTTNAESAPNVEANLFAPSSATLAQGVSALAQADHGAIPIVPNYDAVVAGDAGAAAYDPLSPLPAPLAPGMPRFDLPRIFMPNLPNPLDRGVAPIVPGVPNEEGDSEEAEVLHLTHVINHAPEEPQRYYAPRLEAKPEDGLPNLLDLERRARRKASELLSAAAHAAPTPGAPAPASIAVVGLWYALPHCMTPLRQTWRRLWKLVGSQSRRDGGK